MLPGLFPSNAVFPSGPLTLIQGQFSSRGYFTVSGGIPVARFGGEVREEECFRHLEGKDPTMPRIAPNIHTQNEDLSSLQVSITPY